MANTIKAAKKLVENEDPRVWDILEEVIREILLIGANAT